MVGQELVVTASRLKNEAKALTQSLEKANEEKSAFALEMQRRAIRDELTTLLNRAGFTDAVQKLSTKVAEATLLLIDLDGFKSVNDIYGHKAGDRVLTELARRLIELFGDDAVIGRLGGDEFAIVIDCRLPDEEAELLATRLIATIAIPFSRLERGRVGASIGIFLGSLADLDEAEGSLFRGQTSMMSTIMPLVLVTIIGIYILTLIPGIASMLNGGGYLDTARSSSAYKKAGRMTFNVGRSSLRGAGGFLRQSASGRQQIAAKAASRKLIQASVKNNSAPMV